MNLRKSVHIFYKVHSDSLLARTLNSRGNQFANIIENKVLANIARSTVFCYMSMIKNFVMTHFAYNPKDIVIMRL